ncbi:hypothetical protein MLD38_011419 [Melastoma candidum]|uniref:Uncharacterized protein n=1 Tax=Melastoma candidum TaxID=119954 RepID=A0ACB9R3J4_9MYRT|nr:hypothetical protein MLD38_011419 [Melastoma candidum]
MLAFFHRYREFVKEDKTVDGEPLDLFLKFGLDERTAKNTVANIKVTANLTAVIHEADVADGCNRTVGNLLYTVATKFPANALHTIKTPAQLDAVFAFFNKIGPENFKLDVLDQACGVGVEVSAEEIELAVGEVFDEKRSIILEQRYRTNVGELLGLVRKKLPWADPKIVKQNVYAKLYELLGESTAADNEKPSKKKEKPAKVEWMFHLSHLKRTLIHLSFFLSQKKIIRYDDTNPEAEKREYIDHIREIVDWMGWKPFKVTYDSDYFQDLDELAVELIKRGHAYVDHQTADEIKEYREKKMDSPLRDRPIAESLKLFEDMKSGLIEEGKATLRMKQDMKSDNSDMYDLIAYRIKV